ncbi:MAG: bifunctional hydroxymethylpyrimidine kinase/phosphomethylpyrimidine kinase [Solirubrobacteraceae bacterium]
MPAPLRTVLSIAGSDSGGGAGIQADGKAFSRLGVHGTFAVTAVTAQNTLGVRAIAPIAAEFVAAQVRAVVEDIGVDAVKVGMLLDAAIAAAVGGCLRELPAGLPIVVDPVLVSSTGTPLLAPDAVGELVASVLPRATFATPNIEEARILAAYAGEIAPASLSTAALAAAVIRLGPRCVIVTGARNAGDGLLDLFCDGTRAVEIVGERHRGGASHGSGCTHSAALAALLALGQEPLAAARGAQSLTAASIRDGLASLGRGAGPVNVFGERADRPR